MLLLPASTQPFKSANQTPLDGALRCLATDVARAREPDERKPRLLGGFTSEGCC